MIEKIKTFIMNLRSPIKFIKDEFKHPMFLYTSPIDIPPRPLIPRILEWIRSFFK